jgi:hypothetical protein
MLTIIGLSRHASMLTIIAICLSMHASILTNIIISLSFVLVSLWRIGHQQSF